MHEEILIIDDKVQFSRSLGENLQDLGYRFRAATTGAQALSELRAGAISLVLLDIVLGDEDGLSVLQQIRAAHPRLPVIMITGFASIGTAVSSMKGAPDTSSGEHHRAHQAIDNALKKESVSRSTR
jgi:DNA-binding NtrC family response regulator